MARDAGDEVSDEAVTLKIQARAALFGNGRWAGILPGFTVLSSHSKIRSRRAVETGRPHQPRFPPIPQTAGFAGLTSRLDLDLYK
jgi:hypothetical protein